MSIVQVSTDGLNWVKVDENDLLISMYSHVRVDDPNGDIVAVTNVALKYNMIYCSNPKYTGSSTNILPTSQHPNAGKPPPIPEQPLHLSRLDAWLPEPDKSQGCNHRWEMYTGLLEQFEHCKTCGIEKSKVPIVTTNTLSLSNVKSLNDLWLHKWDDLYYSENPFLKLIKK